MLFRPSAGRSSPVGRARRSLYRIIQMLAQAPKRIPIPEGEFVPLPIRSEFRGRHAG